MLGLIKSGTINLHILFTLTWLGSKAASQVATLLECLSKTYQLSVPSQLDIFLLYI